MISLLLFTQSYMYVLRASFRGAFTPLSQNLSPPLGTCEHCMRCESKATEQISALLFRKIWNVEQAIKKGFGGNSYV